MRFFIFILFIGQILCATDISATYKVSFGIFGQIGIAKANLHIQDEHYKITMQAQTTGLAKVLSGNREEWFESVGVVRDGYLYPDTYKKIVKRNKNILQEGKPHLITKEDSRVYTLNHQTKQVTLFKESKTDGMLTSSSDEILEYYAKDDLLSLFFNFKQISKNMSQKILLKAVGANKKDGRIDLEKLQDTKKFQKEFSWSDGAYFKVIIHDKIFASKQGELFVNLNRQGIAQSAILKDVIFFGDIRGDLIE